MRAGVHSEQERGQLRNSRNTELKVEHFCLVSTYVVLTAYQMLSKGFADLDSLNAL